MHVRTLNTIANGIRASFWRGGTSKGIFLHGQDLPVWRELSGAQKRDLQYCERVLQPFFAAAFGSPDPHGRQLNGMGGGISSLSKAVIIEPSESDTADLDYWFVQIGIRDGTLDMAGNCGNLSSTVAPFALASGLLKDVIDSKRIGPTRVLKSSTTDTRLSTQTVAVMLRNMNTNKYIQADIQATHNNGTWTYEERGDYVLEGVSGKSSVITLSYLDPAGAKTGKPFPTGNLVDEIVIDGQNFKATLSDFSNPGVFIDGRTVGWIPSRKPEELAEDLPLLRKLELLRRGGASKMGMNPDVPSIPKIILLYPPEADTGDIRVQALSMQQGHKAIPGTHALNLGVISKIPGTVAYGLARQRDPQNTVIAHPTGSTEVGAEIVEGQVISAKLVRTSRWLMDGFVNDTAQEDWIAA